MIFLMSHQKCVRGPCAATIAMGTNVRFDQERDKSLSLSFVGSSLRVFPHQIREPRLGVGDILESS